jgi:hypothetical protein
VDRRSLIDALSARSSAGCDGWAASARLWTGIRITRPYHQKLTQREKLEARLIADR